MSLATKTKKATAYNTQWLWIWSEGGATRTHDRLIKSQDASCESPEENARSAGGAVDSTVYGIAKPLKPPDPDLQIIIYNWPALPAAIKTGILAMVEAAKRS